MKIKIIFAWYDLWIGVFIDKPKQTVYIFPVPMLGIVISWGYKKVKLPPDFIASKTDIKTIDREGKIASIFGRPCKYCLGTGKFGVDFITRCRFCGGTGKI